MTHNESNIDRIIRAVAGFAAFIGAFLTFGTLSVVLGVVGAILLATAAVGYCPAYAPFGFSTCKTR